MELTATSSPQFPNQSYFSIYLLSHLHSFTLTVRYYGKVTIAGCESAGWGKKFKLFYIYIQGLKLWKQIQRDLTESCFFLSVKILSKVLLLHHFSHRFLIKLKTIKRYHWASDMKQLKSMLPLLQKLGIWFLSATNQEKQFTYKFMNKGITLCVIPIFSVTVSFSSSSRNSQRWNRERTHGDHQQVWNPVKPLTIPKLTEPDRISS